VGCLLVGTLEVGGSARVETAVLRGCQGKTGRPPSENWGVVGESRF